MMRDEVIEELWNVKDAISKEHGHQVGTLVTYLKGKELLRTVAIAMPTRPPIHYNSASCEASVAEPS